MNQKIIAFVGFDNRPVTLAQLSEIFKRRLQQHIQHCRQGHG
jgi:hypothetical protein